MDQILFQLTQTCQIHTKKKIKYLQVKDLENRVSQNIFLCDECFNDDLECKSKDILKISQIVEDGEKQIITKWPPLEDQEIAKKLKQQMESLESSNSILSKINDYFTNLKNEVMNKIEICQKNVIKQAIELPFVKDQLLKQYQQISQISDLRKILLEGQKSSFEEYHSSCKNFIQQLQSQKQVNTQSLQNLLIKCQQKQQMLNFEFPNQIKEQIIYYIDEIKFFNEQYINLNLDTLDLSNIKSTISSDKLMQLISNKSNFCSDSFLKQVRDILDMMNPILDKIQFENMYIQDHYPIQFSKISNQMLSQINEYVEHQINLQANNQYSNQIQQSLKIKNMQLLIANKTNFIQQNHQQNLIKFFIDFYPFLNQLNLDQLFSSSEKLNLFSQLQDSDTEDLVALLKKRALFQDKNIYERSQSYQQKQALISQKYYKKQEVEQIFRKFPIYDLLQQNMIDILEKIQIMGTQYNESFQRLLIKKNSNRLIEIKVDESNYFGNFKGYDINCVSQNILEKQKKYIFRIKCDINQPIVQFDIGLIQNDNVDKIQGYNDNLSCKFQSLQNKIKYFGGHGIDNITKGKYFCVDNNSIFELRVWIGGKKLEILDYPNYQNKIELVDENKKYLDSYKDLRVYLYLFDQSINYQITEAFIVEQFDI